MPHTMDESATKMSPPLNETQDKFPAGTDQTDRTCWVCGGETAYRNCKIICKNCGFTRDCSDT